MRTRALLLGLAMIAALAVPAHAQTPEPHRAGLVVAHGDGQVVTACVAFEEETITGVDLLRRSGLDVTLGVYGGLGYGVCAIDGEGCDEGEDCFCQCRAEPCGYWVYSHREPDGSWTISGAGAATWMLKDGDVDGWIWGNGTTAPPPVTFAEVCPPEAAEATPEATTDVASQTPTVRPSEPPSTRVTAAVPAEATAGTGDVQTPSAPARTELPLNYVVFGGIALGLGVLVVIGLRRRR